MLDVDKVSDFTRTLKTQDIVRVDLELTKILGGDSRRIAESLEIL